MAAHLMASILRDFAMGSCGPLGLLNIIVSYNVKAYEVRSLSKSGDFSEIDRFVYI